MYSFLKEQNTRPPVFSVYTAEELWTEPHIAKQMLRPVQDLRPESQGLFSQFL